MQNFFFHIRPRKIPAQALRFTHTFGLGGAAALMVCMQLASGLLLNLNYTPLPVDAYLSVKQIQTELFFGQLLRNLHHWTGHALVIVVCLHLLRVFFHGAYNNTRRINWYIGCLLLILVLAANFTGYLLPWDQLAFWAVTIATSMLGYIPLIGVSLQELTRGGTEVGANTLRLFHSFHTTLLPLLFIVAMAYHFWRIRKEGGIKLAKNKETILLPAIPELLVRELAFAALVICCLLLFSISFDAPLLAMADPLLTPENVKAPWYFLWLQELLLHIQPAIAITTVLIGFSAFLLFVPRIPLTNEKPKPIIIASMVSLVLCIGLLTGVGLFLRGNGMKLLFPW